MILRSFGIILAMMLRVSAGDVGLIAMGGGDPWVDGFHGAHTQTLHPAQASSDSDSQGHDVVKSFFFSGGRATESRAEKSCWDLVLLCFGIDPSRYRGF
jgi:hypothetical protein